MVLKINLSQNSKNACNSSIYYYVIWCITPCLKMGKLEIRLKPVEKPNNCFFQFICPEVRLLFFYYYNKSLKKMASAKAILQEYF